MSIKENNWGERPVVPAGYGEVNILKRVCKIQNLEYFVNMFCLGFFL